MKFPILLRIKTDDDGTVIVTDQISTVYGCGPTQQDAIKDYFQSLAEYERIQYEATIEKGA